MSNGNMVSTMNITIVGGGIAGLATALSLVKKPNTHGLKYKITILESASDLSELGAGIQLFANATRILYSLGLENEFSKVANQPSVMDVRRYADDSPIGEIAQNPISEWEYGFPHWQVYRPDFQQLLAEAVGEFPEEIEIQFNKRVQSVDHENGVVTFSDGTKSEADLIVAADGLRGRIRETIPGNEKIKARAFHEFCFRAVVPRERMQTYPATAKLMEAGSLNMVWCGPGIAMLGYPVHAGELYNIVLSVPRPADEEAVGKWSQPGDVGEGAKLLEPFCERTKQLWSLVTECNKWTLGDMPPLASFVSPSGKLAIVGDAAHAILPHSGQGGAQALEDAISLGTIISALPSVSHLDKAMAAWNSLRQERMVGVRHYASGNQAFLMMPDGPGQQKRDEAMKGMTAAWKKELAELGEKGMKNKPKAKADPNSDDLRSPGVRMYICGYDAEGEAKRAIEKVAF